MVNADYLAMIHEIGRENRNLILDLAELDIRTGDEPLFDRARGMPKIIDKILWWLGKEDKQGRKINFFLQ